jgi:hypothetical protein
VLDSFENLLETLKTEDEIGKVIRTHIHFENAINHFLFIALEKPQNLKNVKLDYYGKQYFIAQKVSNQIANSNYKIIKGDWNQFLPEEHVAVSTQKEALILNANGR